MKRSWIVIIVIILLIIIGYSSCKTTYNNMVTKNQDTQAKWGNVESQYQRRNDLYNSVVKTIQGSANFEQSTLVEVVQARAKASQVTVDPSKLTPDQISQFQQAQDQYAQSFSRLLVTVEQYPQLRTTQAFQDFQTQIEGTENRINKARDDFNQSVQSYNTTIKSFPNNLFAGMFGFSEKGYFKANPGTENPPDINFNLNNSNSTTPATTGANQQ